MKSIDFIVPDAQFHTAIKTLTVRGKRLELCPASERCLASSNDRYTPGPAFHMHISDIPDVTVGLFNQSDTLWFLPPLCDIAPFPPDGMDAASPFVVASDQTVLPPPRPGRGSGAFDANKHEHPVLVPRAVVLLEAFMRIYARDSGKQIGSFAMAMIDYMELYVDCDGFLDTTLLPDPLKSFYADLKSGKKPVRRWTKELKDALGVPCHDQDED